MAITPTKKYIDINGLGLYHEEAAPEMTYAEWQALPDSKYSDGREYHITDVATNSSLPKGTIIKNGRIYSGGGAESYNDLSDLPTVNGNTVQGTMTTSDLGINEMSAVVTNEVLIFSY